MANSHSEQPKSSQQLLGATPVFPLKKQEYLIPHTYSMTRTLRWCLAGGRGTDVYISTYVYICMHKRPCTSSISQTACWVARLGKLLSAQKLIQARVFASQSHLVPRTTFACERFSARDTRFETELRPAFCPEPPESHLPC